MAVKGLECGELIGICIRVPVCACSNLRFLISISVCACVCVCNQFNVWEHYIVGLFVFGFSFWLICNVFLLRFLIVFFPIRNIYWYWQRCLLTIFCNLAPRPRLVWEITLEDFNLTGIRLDKIRHNIMGILYYSMSKRGGTNGKGGNCPPLIFEQFVFQGYIIFAKLKNIYILVIWLLANFDKKYCQYYLLEFFLVSWSLHKVKFLSPVFIQYFFRLIVPFLLFRYN